MKRTELAKHKGKKVDNRMAQEATPGRFGSQVAAPDRREQRRRDQALGLVPLAVKIDGGLMKQLQARATERGASLSDVVGEILTHSLNAK
jgi:hypothetical protein